jgi:cell division protein FtsB|tara:strand:- start:1916 stop:2218 length:303 start_codon:yes stop_codon:yes gene_type:complete
MLDKIKKNYFILISTILFLYFFFNLLDGERGLISYFDKKNILKELKNEKIEVTNKINELEIKNSLLTDNLDLDYIETLIRQKFLFGKDGEKIFLIKNNEN